MSLSIGSMLREQIVFHPQVKALARRILTSERITGHPLYRQAYEHRIDGRIAASGKPRALRIENTAHCNADCLFCPHSRMQRKPGRMSDDLFTKLIREARAAGIEHIILHGFGEPLLDKQFAVRVAMAKSMGITKVTTNSNGSLLSGSTARALIGAGLDELYVSFDAATAKDYEKVRPGLDFRTVEANLKQFLNIRNQVASKTPVLNLSYVVCDENRNGLKAYLARWKHLVDHISISCMHNWGKTTSHDKQNGLQKDPCRMLWNEMTVCWDGKVPICCNDYDAKEVVGDASSQPLLEIWRGEAYRRVRHLHRLRAFQAVSMCAGCDYNTHTKSPWWL